MRLTRISEKINEMGRSIRPEEYPSKEELEQMYPGTTDLRILKTKYDQDWFELYNAEKDETIEKREKEGEEKFKNALQRKEAIIRKNNEEKIRQETLHNLQNEKGRETENLKKLLVSSVSDLLTKTLNNDNDDFASAIKALIQNSDRAGKVVELLSKPKAIPEAPIAEAVKTFTDFKK